MYVTDLLMRMTSSPGWSKLVSDGRVACRYRCCGYWLLQAGTYRSTGGRDHPRRRTDRHYHSSPDSDDVTSLAAPADSTPLLSPPPPVTILFTGTLLYVWRSVWYSTRAWPSYSCDCCETWTLTASEWRKLDAFRTHNPRRKVLDLVG